MDKITINTTRFGDIEIEATRVIEFTEPILGFEKLTKFVLLDHAENSPFKWLQSAEEADLAFVITNPKFFGMDYEFVLPQNVADEIGIASAEDAVVVTIVNIPGDNPGKMTANLLGPLIISESSMKARQIVLHDSSYDTKTRLIPDEMLKQQASPSGTSEGE